MRRVPTLFRRDPEDRRFVVPEVAPGAEWVIAGEGRATRQYDGVAVLYDRPRAEAMGVPQPTDGALRGWWLRTVVTVAEPPDYFWTIEDAAGRFVGWEPFTDMTRLARPMADAVRALGPEPEPGTYELIGPRINRNPEGVKGHQLVRHATAEVLAAPRDYEGLREWLPQQPIEGVVWHRDEPDGAVSMVKIKRRDFPRG